MNDKIIVANLKMDMDVSDVSNYLNIINNKIDDKNIIICPTSIYIPYFLKHKYQVGIQNIFYESNGAFTGEVSPKQIKSIGVNYAIVGHNERRTYFNETDLVINKKVKACLDNKIKVILCIGETKEEHDLLKTDYVLRKQINRALNDIDNKYFNNIFIAYEPIWAIGTGIVPKNKEIEDTIKYIKSIVNDNFNYQDINVLYGGSINEKNINKLKNIDNISGYLIGEASINANNLLKIIEIIQKG